MILNNRKKQVHNNRMFQNGVGNIENTDALLLNEFTCIRSTELKEVRRNDCRSSITACAD